MNSTGAARNRLRTALTAAQLVLAVFGLWRASCTQAASDDLAPDRDAARGSAVVIQIQGPIGPAISDFFVRTVDKAQAHDARVVIVELDTPGGLDTSMRQMIQSILASRIPIVSYVAPAGARAASAGTYLMYASHIAAMAPGTNLGAATPVNLMGGDDARPSAPAQDHDKESHKPAQSTMEHKVVNDATAYIRSLAELRGRNADWAESAVRDAASLSASAALKSNVIDVIADDIPDLLHKIDGRTVQVATGRITLDTEHLSIVHVHSDWRTELLSVLTNPTIAYILMLAGIYGLLLEGYHPGAILPGVVGAISLLLALFAFQLLSVNFAGLALVSLGVALMVAESFVPSFGALGIGGIVAFVVGSIMLMDSDIPEFRVALPLLAALATVGAAVMLGIATLAVRSRRRRVVTGREQLLDELATALQSFDREGTVRLHGELWNARTRVPVVAGQTVKIVRVDGLTLHVKPQSTESEQDRSS